MLRLVGSYEGLHVLYVLPFQNLTTVKDKAIILRTCTDLKDSRRLRVPEFLDIQHM